MTTAHEKSLNAWLAWECCAREPSDRFNLLTPWRSRCGYQILASDGYRMVSIAVARCAAIAASVSYDKPCVDPAKRPDIRKTLDQYRWERRDWKPLHPFPRLITVARDYEYDDEGEVCDEEDVAIRHGDLTLGGLLLNSELVWPFTLIPGAQWAVDGVALLIRWDSGVGVVMSRKPPEEDA